MKNVIKFLARRILAKEIAAEKAALEKENRKLREMAFGKNSCLLSATLFNEVIKRLPDANFIGGGDYNENKTPYRYYKMTEKLNGVEYERNIGVIPAKTGAKEKGVTITISGYGISFFIPLRQEVTKYNLFSIDSSINTYFWDIYRAGVKIVTDEAWAFLITYINAQNSAIKSLKQEKLL